MFQPPYTFRTGPNPLFLKGHYLFWSTPKCDNCIHTCPNKSHQEGKRTRPLKRRENKTPLEFASDLAVVGGKYNTCAVSDPSLVSSMYFRNLTTKSNIGQPLLGASHPMFHTLWISCLYEQTSQILQFSWSLWTLSWSGNRQ